MTAATAEATRLCEVCEKPLPLSAGNATKRCVKCRRGAEKKQRQRAAERAATRAAQPLPPDPARAEDRRAEEVREELERLNTEVAKAKVRYNAAGAAAVTGGWEPMLRATKALGDYHRAVHTKQRTADADLERDLTLHLVQKVERDGLVLAPLDPMRPAAGLRIIDPSLAEEVHAAREAVQAATRERDAYAREHAELLKRAEARRAMQELRESLLGDDPGDFARAVQDANRRLPAERPENVLVSDPYAPGGIS